MRVKKGTPQTLTVANPARLRRSTNTILLTLLALVSVVWIFLPLIMAALWSLVDPATPWSYPDALPRSLSFERWRQAWTNTSLPTAIWNSYRLAPVVGLVSIVLASPTAYAFGRRTFPGRAIAQTLSLLPIVLPAFAIGVFFSSVLIRIGLFDRYTAILIGHVVLFMPYAIRILTISFAVIPQDLVDAARDVGTGPLGRIRHVYLPLMLPGITSAFIIIMILSIEEFALAFVLGAPDFTTIPTILFRFLGFEFVRGSAAVVSLVLVVPNIVILLMLERLLSSVGLHEGSKG